jgi:hypothetical protein
MKQSGLQANNFGGPRLGPLGELMGEPAVLFEEKLNYKHPLVRLAPSYSTARPPCSPPRDKTPPAPRRPGLSYGARQPHNAVGLEALDAGKTVRSRSAARWFAHGGRGWGEHPPLG